MRQDVSPSLRPALIALLTDFGLRDGYIGVMKGVIATIAPSARCVDLTHDVLPQDIHAAAWILARSYRYFPAGTIFTCVVDPGVGSTRRPIAVKLGDWLFVGPDNGLLSYVLLEQTLSVVVTLSNPVYHLAQVSATFQGRDIFAPVAAHLAQGVALVDLGTPVDPTTLRRLALQPPLLRDRQITAQIVYTDHFGNLLTNIPVDMLSALHDNPALQLTFPAQNITITECRRFFAEHTGADADESQPFIYTDSSGYLAVAVYNGDAARQLAIHIGDRLVVTI